MSKTPNPPNDIVSFTLHSQETATYRPGDLIGESYLLESLIAVGGMGVVYQAKHIQLDALVALKLLEPRQMSTANWRRFELEARTLAKLHHPNIVQIFNMGIEQRGCPYYVMELLKGKTVADALSETGTLSIPQFIQCFLDVLSALEFAHKKNIVHRDIKPSNLMLIDSEFEIKQTKVVDFGIARSIEVEGNQSTQSLTLPGQVFGTPSYMSPEQIQGLSVSQVSDIYSLGCTMFEAFTGSPPFQGKTSLDAMLMHKSMPVPEIYRDDCSPSDLAAISPMIVKCMAKDPADRFSNVSEILNWLTEFSDSEPEVLLFQDAHEIDEDKDGKPKESVRKVEGTSKSKTKLVFASLASLLVLTAFSVAVLLNHETKTKPKIDVFYDVDFPEVDMNERPEWEWLKSTKPVSKLVVDKNGIRKRVFEFSDEKSIGRIYESEREIKAIGTVTTSDKPIRFVSSKELAKDPQFYKRFDNEAISTLLVKGTSEPPSIETLKSWKNLRIVEFVDCVLNDSYVQSLGQLQNLYAVALRTSHFSPRALIGSGVLLRITKFEMTHPERITEILESISHSDKLTFLTMKAADFSSKDFELISEIPKLGYLDVSQSRISPGAFRKLVKSKSLRELHIEKTTGVTVDDLDEIVRIPGFHKIVLTELMLTPSAKSRLQSANSGLELTELLSDFGLNGTAR